MFEENAEDKKAYWSGSKNKAIRYYFYIQNGLKLLNEFRYLLMSIFAVYYALKMNNIFLIPLMFVIVLPILIVLGWISIHHMEKVMDYLQIQFATHWGRKQFNLQEKQIKLLEGINEKLKTNTT